MRDKDVLKLLLQNGWVVTRVAGSHHILVKNDETLVVPIHGKDMKKGLLHKILKQANLEVK